MTEQSLPTIADRLRVLREGEAATVLNVHTQTLRRWRREGSGPAHIRVGAKLYGYRVGDLETWQDQRRTA